MKEKLQELVKLLKTKRGQKILLTGLTAILAVLLVVKGSQTIYSKMNSKILECTYESAVADYSKLKIEESIENVFVKDKRTKMIQKTVYTILNDDKDTLNTMKEERKMYVSTFDEIEGASAKYKAKGYSVTTTVTYHLTKMEESKLTDLALDTTSTYEEIKEYYEGYGYTCK